MSMTSIKASFSLNLTESKEPNGGLGEVWGAIFTVNHVQFLCMVLTVLSSQIQFYSVLFYVTPEHKFLVVTKYILINTRTIGSI